MLFSFSLLACTCVHIPNTMGKLILKEPLQSGVENYRPTQDSCWRCQQSNNPSEQRLYISVLYICFLSSVWTDSWWHKQCCCWRRRALRAHEKRGGVVIKSEGSFAGQLAVKARQANGKGLKSTHGVVVVQSEDVFSNSPKLHYNVVS